MTRSLHRRLFVASCIVAGLCSAFGAERALSVYREDAIPPNLRAEIVRETPGRIAAYRTRMAVLKTRIEAELPDGTMRGVRNRKRMEVVERLIGFAEREYARGNTDGLAFAFRATEDLKSFERLFEDELVDWKRCPVAPGVAAETVRVTDFGAKGDGREDNAAAFGAAIAKARSFAGKPTIVEIPEGTFLFSSATNLGHVVLSGLTNVVLRGVSPEKTRLRFGDFERTGVNVVRSRNVTVAGVDLAGVETPFAQGDIVEFNKQEGWVIIRRFPASMEPDDPRLVNGPTSICLGVFDESGKEAFFWGGLFYANRADNLGGGLYRVYLQREHFMYPRPHLVLKPGWKIVIPARKGSCTCVIVGDESYLCNLADLWVRNGRGSIVGLCCEARYSSAWRVRTKFLVPGLVATSCADAIMNHRGTFIGECVFENVNDDGANCYSLGRRIIRTEGDRTAVTDWLPCRYEPGDAMVVASGLTGQYLYLGRVARTKSPYPRGGTQATTFEEPLPADLRTFATLEAKRPSAADDFNQMVNGAKVDVENVPDQLYRPYMFGVGHILYRTRFSSLRGSGSVLACPNALIEETTFEHMNRGVSLSSLGCLEGPAPYNVLIRNCTFRNCSVGIEGRCMTPNGTKWTTCPIRGLTLKDNCFKDVEKSLIPDNIAEDAEFLR